MSHDMTVAEILLVEDSPADVRLTREALRAVSYTHLTLPTIYSV